MEQRWLSTALVFSGDTAVGWVAAIVETQRPVVIGQ